MSGRFALSFAARLLCLFALLVGVTGPAVAQSKDEKAQTAIHLLDYVGVDYPGVVKDGKVLDASEYAEQKEFTTQSVAILQELPDAPQKAAVIAKARNLLAQVEGKAAGTQVSALAAEVRADVIRTWNLVVAPRQTPDLQRGSTLFAAQCAACHGAQGRGDGPAAKGLDPAPSNFHDADRMGQRSLYGLYNTVSLGVKGTSMRSFNDLSEADRWALAFFVATMRADPKQVAQGEAAWASGAGKQAFTGLKDIVMPAPGEVAARDAALGNVHAYLTAHPEALAAARPAPVAFARDRMQKAVEAVRAGDREAARQFAISAYLEGFELVERTLDNIDAPLRKQVEVEMIGLRSTIADGKPADEVATAVKHTNELLDRVEEKLSGDSLSPTTAFFSSLLILLREGLEAILVLAAIGAFVVKTGRRDALPYMHAGWITAVVLGAITWFVATFVFDVSGASREMTEGVTALVAAVMLLYVGWWLHARSYANAWASFIRQQVSAALEKRTLWAMAGVSFLAVYRELFELVLFYQTLWAQSSGDSKAPVLWGIVAAALLLLVIGAAVVRFSVRLPIGPFFSATSALLALLAVVFVGNGIAALQEAGVLAASPVGFSGLPLLGIHPTVQGVAWQLAVLALVVLGLQLNRRAHARSHARPA